MNKKQLIVAWVMGIIISAIFFVVPKINYYEGSYIKGYLLQSSLKEKLATLTNWSLVLSYSIIVLIIGGLLIYTLM
jgi:hypothetical protein